MTAPSAAERIRRGSPIVQTTRAVTPQVRVKPVRVTVDLAPADYDALRDWAHHERISHADVLRRLVKALLADPEMAARVAAGDQ